MKKTATLIFFLLAAISLNAQQINGIVTDKQKKSIAGVTIFLLSARDSLIKLSASDKDGNFVFQHIKAGRYCIRASHAGYADGISTVFDYDDKTNFTIIALELNIIPRELQEVVVNSQKPMIEIKADRTILNIEGTINATGGDAFDLFRKSPGVLIDKDDNISLNGKNGVQIYIDGRPSPLIGKDLSENLKTIPSAMIESIELIIHPSAKYDAAGNAGIINIKLKKNKSFGTNGSFSGGYNIGTHAKYNKGFSLNHRNKKINLFFGYNFSTSKNESHIYINRVVLDTLFDQQTTIISRPTTYNFKAGADYFIDSKSILGVLVNGNLTHGYFNSTSETPIAYNPTLTTVKYLYAGTESVFTRNSIITNINYKYVDTSGKELNIDADYGFFKVRNDQYQPNYYYNPSGITEISRFIYQMFSPSDIHIYSFKTDYEQPFQKGKLGIGVKASYVASDNDFQRFNVFSSGKVMDTLKSNLFNYKENITAVYLNYNKPGPGWILQVGLRIENTHSTGQSAGFRKSAGLYVSYDSTFDRKYIDFFPTAAITFNKTPLSQWNITYSRRIDRPAYKSLNPFELKLDEYTYMKGNTQLTPQYTNSIGISNTFKYKLVTGLSYSHVKDVFTQMLDTAERSKAFLTQKNLATQDIVSFNISYPLQIKWYSAFINASSYYSHYKADFGVGRTVDLDVFAFNYSMQNSFKLGKGWTGEITGFFNSPTISQGTFKAKTLWNLDMGIQKVLIGGKANFRLNVSDIFKTLLPDQSSDFAGQVLRNKVAFESRQLKINFTYRFGSNQVKASRQRKSGSEDESKRVQAAAANAAGN
jgi:iron complex outermembrane receptor protein